MSAEGLIDGAFRTKVREFDPLGIGAWAPESEFDYMLQELETMASLDETEFVDRATAYFMDCFGEDELARSRQEVEAFFKGLHREGKEEMKEHEIELRSAQLRKTT